LKKAMPASNFRLFFLSLQFITSGADLVLTA
jgi:hypothetical protein